jgi:hypothetical protein
MKDIVYVFELARIHRGHSHTSQDKLLLTYEDYAIYSKIWHEMPAKYKSKIIKRVVNCI